MSIKCRYWNSILFIYDAKGMIFKIKFRVDWGTFENLFLGFVSFLKFFKYTRKYIDMKFLENIKKNMHKFTH